MVLPETGHEDNTRNVTFVDTFMEDYQDYHPRLEECLDLYPLEEHEEWKIIEDGTLHHINATASTPLYCIESIIVCKLFLEYLLLTHFYLVGSNKKLHYSSQMLSNYQDHCR